MTRPVCPLDFPASTAALVIFIAPLPRSERDRPPTSRREERGALRERHPLRGKAHRLSLFARTPSALRASRIGHHRQPAAWALLDVGVVRLGVGAVVPIRRRRGL